MTKLKTTAAALLILLLTRGLYSQQFAVLAYDGEDALLSTQPEDGAQIETEPTPAPVASIALEPQASPDAPGGPEATKSPESEPTPAPTPETGLTPEPQTTPEASTAPEPTVCPEPTPVAEPETSPVAPAESTPLPSTSPDKETEEKNAEEESAEYIAVDDSQFEMYVSRRTQIYNSLAPAIEDITEQFENDIENMSEDVGSAGCAMKFRAADGEFSTIDSAQIETLCLEQLPDALALYVATCTSLEPGAPLDLLALQNESWEGLYAVFADTLPVAVLHGGDSNGVLISQLSWEDLSELYGLDSGRRQTLERLMQPEYQQMFAALTGNTVFEGSAAEDEERILNALPEELSEERRSVIENASTLLGRVSYFWGGKSTSLGWDEGWGLPRYVSSGGSASSGQQRIYGLDCSGFVSWAFINAFGDPALLNQIGNGTSMQWDASQPLEWTDGQPGDLLFANSPSVGSGNHVGIIVSRNDDGSYLAIHCTGGGVILSDAEDAGFNYVRRPSLY